MQIHHALSIIDEMSLNVISIGLGYLTYPHSFFCRFWANIRFSWAPSWFFFALLLHPFPFILQITHIESFQFETSSNYGQNQLYLTSLIFFTFVLLNEKCLFHDMEEEQISAFETAYWTNACHFSRITHWKFNANKNINIMAMCVVCVAN